MTGRSTALAFGRWALATVLTLIVWLAFPIASEARFGGGHSYSSGSSHSSSSRSSSNHFGSSRSNSSGSIHFGGGSSAHGGSSDRDGGSIAGLVFVIVIILVIVVAINYFATTTISGPSSPPFSVPAIRDAKRPLNEALAELARGDPNFSKVLFFDFACLLFHKYYSLLGTEDLKILDPFFASSFVDQGNRNIGEERQQVSEIVIGQRNLANLLGDESSDILVVNFDANFTVTYRTNGEKVRYWTVERWVFGRRKGVISLPPGRMRALTCPACGAPANFTDAGLCPYCNTVITSGDFQWEIRKVAVLSREVIDDQPQNVGKLEVGTDRQTIYQPDLDEAKKTFVWTNDLENWDVYFERFRASIAQPYFQALYSSWSRGDLMPVRHLLSDRLFEANQYWMRDYSRRKLRNIVSDLDVETIEIAAIEQDAFYDAFTVRIFAACLDYTVNEAGKVVAGSKKTTRRYSEYWTFIRVKGKESADRYDLKSCPACGAPANKIAQAGTCGYCNAKLTEGDYSWVLSAIAQDEVYSL